MSAAGAVSPCTIAGVWSDEPGAGADACRALLAAVAPARASMLEPAPGLLLVACARSEGGDTVCPPAPLRHGTPLVADLGLTERSGLAARLGLAPSTPDEAILAAGWDRWRYDLPREISGEFAFALWDAAEQTLFLARDHVGARPLHFARGRGAGFAFASLPQGMPALPGQGCRIDRREMARFLAALTPTPGHSIFEGIEVLPPGHWIKVSRTRLEVRRYWHPLWTKPIRYARDADYIEDFRERFDRAVAERLPADADVAVQLSAGLDSASVAVTASRLLPPGRRITAYTAVPGPGWDGAAPRGRFGDEGPGAAEVAALCANVEHVRVPGRDGRHLVESLRRANRLAGRPILNPTHQLWQDAILDGARARGLGVLLYGEAGNNTISFGGLIGLSSLFRRLRWIRLFRLTRELRAGGHTSWKGAAAWATAGLVPERLRLRYHPLMRDFSFDYSALLPAALREFALDRAVMQDFFGVERSVAGIRRHSYEYYDPGVHQAAEAAGWGIEARDPTLDRRIFEFCYAIPIEQYLAGGQARSLVRRAMAGRLPEATLRRTTRGLQAADWPVTVRAALPALSQELGRIRRSPLAASLLDLDRLGRLLESFPASGFGEWRVLNSYHLALTRGIAAGSFMADQDAVPE
jgi:asparagine synthase (glutamine-hydrolysing)